MAITYGMSVKEFWEEDPDLFWAYRFSYYNKLKENEEIFNYQAWLQGAYFYEALNRSIHNTFCKQEEKIEYLNEPFGEQDPLKEELRKQQELENQVADIKARIAQVNAIRNCTTIKGKDRTKGGEK